MTALHENQLTESLSLNGTWELSVAGQQGQVQVPGVWETQGYPMFACGTAHYRRVQHIPASWADARVILRFHAVSYHVQVYVNGHLAGTHEGLWTAFELDITSLIRTGADNEFSLEIIKPGDEGEPFPYREVLVGFIPYVSLTFGGPWRDVELLAHREPTLHDIQITPDWQTGQVRVQALISDLRQPDDISAAVTILDQQGRLVANSTTPHSSDQHRLDVLLHVPDAALWSPSNPALYHLQITLSRAQSPVAQTKRTFGFRALHAVGEQLMLNGQPVQLRGILSWGWYPDSLAPTPSAEQIRAEFRRVRELGFNLYKLCLYVPIPQLFEIANEEGMLLWLELPLWWQRLTDHLRHQAVVEYNDILRTVHSHPSLVLVSLGCELGSDMADAAMLEQLSSMAREWTCGTLLCDNSGSGEAYKGLGFDYSDFTDYHFYCDLHYFTPLMDHFRRDWQQQRPWIFGEFCANEDYRDPTVLLASDGGRPWWRDVYGVGSGIDRWAYSEQEARLAAHQLPFDHNQLMRFARHQSLVVRKNIIEQARARRDAGGYVVTGLRDTPITTSGIFDDFDRSKIDPATFRMFNADTVLLLEQGRARVWIDGDRPAPFDRFNYLPGSSLSFRILLAHIGAELPSLPLNWSLRAPDGSEHTSGLIPLAAGFAAGPARQIARLEIELPADAVTGKWTLHVQLGTVTENYWSLWVFPPALWHDGTALYDPAGCLQIEGLPRVHNPHDCAGVLIASAYTPELNAYVRDGGRAIVLQNGTGVLPAKPIAFWQEGIRLFYDHPVLARFPHEGVTDLQFYHLASEYAFDTASFAAALPDLVTWQPVLRRLHARLFTMLDYLVECQVGQGKMLASSLRFSGGAGDQVHGLKNNIAGEFLLKEMVAYLSGSRS